MARTRVAVLGGGVGSLVAAFELTSTAELRDRFDVTVYQLGWRLGGKGASGRNANFRQRIEEHGLHVWFGFYDEAFRVMRSAYEELGRPAGAPLATLDDAFEPADEIVLFDRQGDGWHPFVFRWPRNLEQAGRAGPLPDFWQIAYDVVRWMRRIWQDPPGERPSVLDDLVFDDLLPDWGPGLVDRLGGELDDFAADGVTGLLRLAEDLAGIHAPGAPGAAPAPGPARRAHLPFLAELLVAFRDAVWDQVRGRVGEDPDLRLHFTVVDTAITAMAGLIADDVLERGFDAINGIELCTWLSNHGAKEVTIGRTPEERSPVLRSIYDVAFAYKGGDISQADVAAGTAMNDLLRMLFGYRGAFFYKMQAGMGDTVFGPFYEVLKARRVAFRFFHAVTRLGLSPDGRAVDEIDIVEQVDLTDGSYDPLVDVRGLPCWPSEPRWDQLVDGAELRRDGINFELEPNPLQRPPRTLRRGEHFDAVVCGLSVDSVREVGRDLIDRLPPWKAAIAAAETVRTQAFQLWLTESAEDLGWTHDPRGVAGAYVEPLDTYCDMTHLLDREDHPAGEVASIAYFCGVLAEDTGDPVQATQHAHDNALQFLREDIASLWPAACQPHGVGPLRWDVLYDPGDGVDEARFEAQYWRANTVGSERYVLTPAGSVDVRLRPDGTGIDNLVVTGDWTRTGVDGGCVEAAAISGVRAASSLIGDARRIPGEDTRWLALGGPPSEVITRPAEPPAVATAPYIEYGARVTTPGPFLCEGGLLRGLVLEGDPVKLERFVDRALNAPADGEVTFRPLGPHVLLLIGGFESVSATTPPFADWGSVREMQAGFFVPVLVGRDRRDVFIADRLTLTVPYIVVDNPISYLGGREDYGFPKAMGAFRPSHGLADRMSVSVFGGDFGRDAQAAWRPFLEVAPADVGAPDEKGTALRGSGAVVARVVGGKVRESRGSARASSGEIRLPGVRLVGSLVSAMLRGRVSTTYLKQFRDATDGTLACYQRLIDAPLHVRHLRAWPSRREWEVTVHRLDSHPIGEELGIGTQRASQAFDVELDFVVEAGRALG
jgi:uncharacterized protein with NAD-binding domain and iron-sulfur cluster